jgi:hypothetical protein
MDSVTISVRNSITRMFVVGLITALVLPICFCPAAASTPAENSIDILLVLDHDYGANVPEIITILNRFGWNITTTALVPIVNSCDYLHNKHITVDMLISEIEDITIFDAISIMPGESHEQLRINQSALGLIQSAMAENLIVSAWCRAVRVLVAADVINGKNITGNADYESEYIAAGATFNELVPPVIDGNLVTGCRSRFYREEMCEAIATAMGVYEADHPTLDDIIITPDPSEQGQNITLTVEVSDVSSIYQVMAKIFELNSSGMRVSDVQVLSFKMNTTNSEGVLTYTLADLALGTYCIDLDVYDIFMNNVTYMNAANFTVATSVLSSLVITVTIGGAILVVAFLVLFLRRRL